VVTQAAHAAAKSDVEDPALAWVARLAQAHPGDLGVLAPLYLNLLELAPGEALFLGAGELHCYLGGTAVEVMASSDNVLRGGLTAKHVDRAELLRVLRFEPVEPHLVAAESDGPHALYWPAPARQFRLGSIRLERGAEWREPEAGAVEILLCIEGSVRVAAEGGRAELPLGRGESCLVPACVGAYAIAGEAALCRVTVPD
jgi:mannose-6-phosphate isomerase